MTRSPDRVAAQDDQATRTSQQPSPFLRWAGSKRQLVPQLASFWRPSFIRYVEPFMGSACLFFSIQPKTAVLNDLNAELVNTFSVVRTRPGSLALRLTSLPRGRRSFLRLRDQDPSHLGKIDAAARFIFLNRFCFNGLFRTNRQGRFNVPYAPTRTGHLPSAQELATASRSLRCATLTSHDFATTLAQTQRGDFVYLDPPFAVENRRVFRQYGPQTFGLDDLRRLSAQLHTLDRKGVAFLLSYACCPEGRSAFRFWPSRRVRVHRNVAGFAHFRRTAIELLVSNSF